MKQMTWITVACLAAGLAVLGLWAALDGPAAAAPAHPHTQSEQLQNPDFETASGGVPDGWETYGAVVLRQIVSPTHSGSFAAVLTNTADSTRWAFQLLPVSPGSVVEFSAWAVKDDPHVEAAYLRIWWYESADGSGGAMATTDSPSLTSDDPAYRFLTTGPVTVPPDALSARAMLRVDPDGSGMDGAVIFDQASFQSADPLPAADLAVAKSGPLTATAGDLLTYTIGLSNVGTTTATATLLTDTLPPGAIFLSQSSPFSLVQVGSQLVWDCGAIPAGSLQSLTVTARLTGGAPAALANQVKATTAISEPVTVNNEAVWTTTLNGAQVLLSAVLYDGYQLGDGDEAVQLLNAGSAPADLTGWRLDDGYDTSYASFVSGTLQPGQQIWVAWQAAEFACSFGFLPDYEVVDTEPAVPDLAGLWPGYSNSGDEVVLRDAADRPVDVLVYEAGMTTTPGWSGPALEPYRAGQGRLEGQVLYRILDEGTGRAAVDTDRATDWAQYVGDPANGRRVCYPGWDLASLYQPLSRTTPATVEVGIAPDNAFDVVSATIARARHAISVEVYSLRHPQIVAALERKAQAGVEVTVLLEGRQAWVSYSDPDWQQELWACQRIESAGGQCWFMVHQPDQRVFNRYDYLHAKVLIVDDEWLLVGSQNLSPSSLPCDDRSNGTYGSRGVVVAVNSAPVVARAAAIFRLDLDPEHHRDLLRWSPDLTGTYGPPVITYTPQLTSADATTSPVRFHAPLVVSGSFGFELFTAPEAALRRSDALLGLVARAGEGDVVLVEQLYEHADWGEDPTGDPNLRLEAYVDAARRGATVHILLNGGTFGQINFRSANTVTVAYVNHIARSEGLDLAAALGDPTRYGIHNKMVLVWLQEEGGFVHTGSINGSEGSNKVNREMALQIHSDAVYTYLRDMFEADWHWAHPLYLPLALHRYVAPADHLLISEVSYHGSCEWVELYNPTPVTLTLQGYGVGDAQTRDSYEAMYRLPFTVLPPGEVLLIAADATRCSGLNPDYEMAGADPVVPNLTLDPSWGTGDFGLGNQGDEVVLLDAIDRRVDAVAYGNGAIPGLTPHPGVEWGDTLERVPADTDTDDCSEDFRAGWSPGWVQLR